MGFDLDVVSQLGPPVMAFYLILFCNFVPELVGCRLRNFLRENMLSKHVIGFLLLFFLVVLVAPGGTNGSDMRLVNKLCLSIAIYVWFLITTRSHMSVMIVQIALLMILYLVNAKRKLVQSSSNEPDASDASKASDASRQTQVDKLEMIENVIGVSLLIISIVGFATYAIEKKREYGTDFSVSTFVFGKTECRGWSPSYFIGSSDPLVHSSRRSIRPRKKLPLTADSGQRT